MLPGAAAGIATLTLCTGCVVAVVAVARHEQRAVVVTQNPADVAACRRLGPVGTGLADTAGSQSSRLLRGETVHLGGNTLFVPAASKAGADAPRGIAYRCERVIAQVETRPTGG